MDEAQYERLEAEDGRSLNAPEKVRPTGERLCASRAGSEF